MVTRYQRPATRFEPVEPPRFDLDDVVMLLGQGSRNVVHRPARPKSFGFPPWALYLVAGLLLLASVPLYRGIFSALRAVPVSPSPAVRVVPAPVVRHAVVSAAPVPSSSVRFFRYPLADNQHCYAGAVVQVDGSVYTQLGTLADPIYCVNRMATRPVR